jgi:hypothetical protein
MTLHADHIGSLLRPPELLEARAAHDRGDLSDDALTAPGNLITWDDQSRKLELVVSVADEVWGS